MTSRSDEYRQKAAEAKYRAVQTISPSIKGAFEEVARGWLLLAEQMEWIEGRRSSLLDEDTSTHGYAATRLCPRRAGTADLQELRPENGSG